MPQFADPNKGSATLQLLTLGLTFALLTLMIFSVIPYFSGSMGDWLVNRPGFADGMRWLTGGVLIGLRLRFALPERR